jgi:hypothetical protein
MKPVYANLTLQKGSTNHGIVSVRAVPKEWLANEPSVDFATGKIIKPVLLAPGKNWIGLQFTESSYKYDEKPKSNKSGSYYEITLSGSLNNYDSQLQQVMETLRYHELVAVVMDRNKRMKLAGSTTSGFVFSPTNNMYAAVVDLIMESEAPAPFYSF